ncbi:hypothetical protein A4A49_06449, partial [Nicotiana attenuata]
EWIQARKNKYQWDNRGHIVDNKQGKEADKGKGKTKLEEVATKNKFNALEVEEAHQPILQITEGKGEDLSNGKKKEHGENQSKIGYEKEKEGNTGASSPNPNSGVRVGKDANTKPVGEDNQQELKRVKKEAVEKVLKDQYNGNLAKANPIVPSDQSTDEKANKESTIDWVHRRFGTSKEELRQLNVTTNQSCQDMSSQTFADSGQLENLDEINSTKAGGSDAIEVEDDQIGTTKTTGDKVRDNSPPGDRLATLGLKPSSPGVRLAMPGLKPGIPGVRLATPGLALGSPDEASIVNTVPSATGKILVYVDGVPVYALENKLHDNMKVRDDTVGSKNNSENNDEHAIVPRESGEIVEVPMEYGTDQIMQLQLNVPLKTPLQHLHDLVTHNVAPIDEDLMRQNPMEDEGDNESTEENFKQAKGDLSYGKKKEHGENQSKKGYEKEKEGNTGGSSPNPKASGVRVGKDAKTKPVGDDNQQELKRVKKEAVEKVLKDQHNRNLPIIPSDQSTDEKANKESIINWVHRRFGTSKEELSQLNVTTNQSCQDMPSQTFADSGATGKILAYVDGVPVYALENKLDDNVKFSDDTVGSNNNSEKNDEHTIVLRASGEIEEVPMEYGTDQIMQLQLNVRLKTPLQHLHDLVTQNVAPVDEDLMRQNPMEDEGDDEPTEENFKQVARDGNLSPTTSAKGGKKTKKNQNKESQQPLRIMPRRATSISK